MVEIMELSFSFRCSWTKNFQLFSSKVVECWEKSNVKKLTLMSWRKGLKGKRYLLAPLRKCINWPGTFFFWRSQAPKRAKKVGKWRGKNPSWIVCQVSALPAKGLCKPTPPSHVLYRQHLQSGNRGWWQVERPQKKRRKRRGGWMEYVIEHARVESIS